MIHNRKRFEGQAFDQQQKKTMHRNEGANREPSKRDPQRAAEKWFPRQKSER